MLPEPVPDGVRPTSSRVREALFSMIGQDLHGQTVLDAFGGTGLLALEAWSRGGKVTVVERDPRVARAIQRNARALDAHIEIKTADVCVVAAGFAPFDVVLVDPPYAERPAPILDVLGPLARRVLVLEVDDGTVAPSSAGGFGLERRRVYGGTALALYTGGILE